MEEWRSHPVSDFFKTALLEVTEEAKESLVGLYLSGKAAPEAQRLGVLHQEKVIKDIFEASNEDIFSDLGIGGDA